MQDKKKSKVAGVVYSTDHGRMCSECSNPVEECSCRANASGRLLGDGRVRISRATKGRKGKGVSVISGLPLTAEQLAALAKKLKRACGVGGAVKGNTIEVQSENREQLLQLLEQEGFKGKLSGS